jgi:hypothetical protein
VGWSHIFLQCSCVAGVVLSIKKGAYFMLEARADGNSREWLLMLFIENRRQK